MHCTHGAPYCGIVTHNLSNYSVIIVRKKIVLSIPLFSLSSFLPLTTLNVSLSRSLSHTYTFIHAYTHTGNRHRHNLSLSLSLFLLFYFTRTRVRVIRSSAYIFSDLSRTIADNIAYASVQPSLK